MRLRIRRLSVKLRLRMRPLRRKANVGIPVLVLGFLFILVIFFACSIFLTDTSFDHSLARALLRWGMPHSSEFEGYTRGLELRSLIYFLTSYDLGDPLSLLEATLPFSVPSASGSRAWEERPFVFIQELTFAPDPIRPHEAGVKSPEPDSLTPRVLIYHTHTSEMYLGGNVAVGTSQAAHYTFRTHSDPTITGVMEVGRHLANALNKLGIGTIHETKIHTLPTLDYAYANSEKTVREILTKLPSIGMVLDVHRDADVPEPVAQINGRNVAKLLLVVGTAETIPLSHPNYQKNLAFARRLKEISDRLYPGLMRPIQIRKDARYNQHLHPNSVIIELGSVENTLEEALLSAELLAKILAQAL